MINFKYVSNESMFADCLLNCKEQTMRERRNNGKRNRSTQNIKTIIKSTQNTA